MGKRALYKAGRSDGGNTSSITVLLEEAILDMDHRTTAVPATEEQLAELAKLAAGRVN